MNIYSLLLFEVVIMPNKDGTGPAGKGSKTGRQLGNCENTKPIERGCGRGRGFGRRCRADDE
jgi:hypothetical protein